MLAQQNKAAARKLSKNFGTGTRLSVGCRAAALLSVAAAGSRLRRTDVSAAGKPVAEKAFAVGYWFGFGHFACGLFWINNALMMDLPRLGWLIPLCFAGSGGFFGLFAAFPALFCRFSKAIGPDCWLLPQPGRFSNGSAVSSLPVSLGICWVPSGHSATAPFRPPRCSELTGFRFSPSSPPVSGAFRYFAPEGKTLFPPLSFPH